MDHLMLNYILLCARLKNTKMKANLKVLALLLGGLATGITFWTLLWYFTGWIGVAITITVLTAFGLYIRLTDVEDNI